MYDHYSLSIRAEEHRAEMVHNADTYRLLQEGRTTTGFVPALFQHVASLYRSVTDHMVCRLSGWRYRMLMRIGAEPSAQPCS